MSESLTNTRSTINPNKQLKGRIESSIQNRKEKRMKNINMLRNKPPPKFAIDDYVIYTDDSGVEYNGFVKAIDTTVDPITYGIRSDDYDDLLAVPENYLSKIIFENTEAEKFEPEVKRNWRKYNVNTGVVKQTSVSEEDKQKQQESLALIDTLREKTEHAFGFAKNPSGQTRNYEANTGIENASILELIYIAWGVMPDYQNEPLFLTGLEENEYMEDIGNIKKNITTPENWIANDRMKSLNKTDKDSLIRPDLIKSVEIFEKDHEKFTDPKHVPLCIMVSVGDEISGYEWHSALLLLYFDYDAQTCKVISVGEGYSEAARHQKFDTRVPIAKGLTSSHTGKIAIFSPDRWTKYTTGGTKNPNYIVTGIFLLTSTILHNIDTFMQKMDNAYFYKDADGIYDRTEFTTNDDKCVYMESGKGGYSCVSWVSGVLHGLVDCTTMTPRMYHYLVNPKTAIKATGTAVLGIENPSLCVDKAFGSIMPNYWFQQLVSSCKEENIEKFSDILMNKQKYRGFTGTYNVTIYNGIKYVNSLIHPPPKKSDFGEKEGGRRKTKRNKKNRNRKSRKPRK